MYRTAQISNPAAAAAAATATEAFNPQAFITCYNKADLMINALVNTYEDNGWQLPEMSISQAVERNFRLRPARPTKVIPESVEESELRKLLCFGDGNDDNAAKYPRWLTKLRSNVTAAKNNSSGNLYDSFRIASKPEDVVNLRRNGVRTFSDLKVWLDAQVAKL